MMYQIRHESRRMAKAVGYKSEHHYMEFTDAAWAMVVFNFHHLKLARRKARKLVRSGDSIYGFVSIWKLSPHNNDRKLIENICEGKRVAATIEVVSRIAR